MEKRKYKGYAHVSLVSSNKEPDCIQVSFNDHRNIFITLTFTLEDWAMASNKVSSPCEAAISEKVRAKIIVDG